MRQSSSRFAAALVALSLITAACGSDRGSSSSTASTAAPTTTAAPVDSAAPTTAGSATSTPATGDTVSPETTPVTEAVPAGPTFGDAPWPCGPGSGANKDDGSTPGVTAKSIAIADGDDAGYAGSPGLNQQMTDAMKAMIAKCNELGGINGRIITGNYYDAALFNVGPAIQGACDDKNFFLVGEGWAFDSNQEEIRLGCGLPAVPSYATSAAFAHGKDVFAPTPSPADEQTAGHLVQMAKLFPDAVKSAVTLVGAFTATQESRDRVVAAAVQFGWEFKSTTIEYNPVGEADWTPFVKQIQAAGAKIVYWSGTCLPNLQLFMQSAKANGLDVPVLTEANHYEAGCAAANGDGAMNNVYVRMGQVPYEEAADSKATQDYLDLLKASGGKISGLGESATSAFLLWAGAASACGDTLTRECTIANLKNVHDWTGHGMFAPSDPGANHPQACSALLKLDGTKYVRVTPTKPASYDCDPSWIAKVSGTPALAAAKLDANRISQQFAVGG
jgi:hypothetical protein